MMPSQIAIMVANLLLAGGFTFVVINAARRPDSDVPGKTRRIIGNILIALAGVMLVGAGSAKFAHLPPVVAEMDSLNMTGWKLTAVASLELLAAFLFLLKPLRSVGLLVMSAYLGGAICAHLASDQYFAILPGTLALGFCWLGVALRHPKMLWSLREFSARP
jgi:DoxX-like family